MTTLRQAAEMALEAMKDFDYDKRLAAIEAVEQALAEQEQGHVALKVYRGELCYKSQEDDQSFGMWCPIEQDRLPFAEGTKFYTAPPQRQWVGLTEDEKNQATKWSVEHIENFLRSKNEQQA